MFRPAAAGSAVATYLLACFGQIERTAMFNLNKRIIRQALDLSPVATIIVDLKTQPHRLVYVNQAFEAVSGYDAGELINLSWDELLAESDDESSAEGRLANLQCHPRLGVAEQICLELLPLYDQPGAPQYWVGTEREPSQVGLDEQDTERDALLSVLRDARMHLRRLDGRDSATGILNRRTFDDLLRRDWVMARREQRNLSVLIFRLDHFDAYRDVYGRHAADSCLGKVAHAITGSLRRAGDLAARYSDDQFVVLVGHDDDASAAKLGARIADKVRGLSIHHPRSQADRFVTVSFGAASTVPSASQSASGLLQRAEECVGAENPRTENPRTENLGADNALTENTATDNTGTDNAGTDNAGTDNAGEAGIVKKKRKPSKLRLV